MSLIAVVAEPTISQPWAQELQRDGYEVACHWGPSCSESLFSGDIPEIVIVDIAHPEWPESMLIPQSRAIWPNCRIVAVVPSYTFRTSAVYEMGLWEPNQLLLKPLTPRLLAATVTYLWAQLRTQEIKQQVRETAAAMRQFGEPDLPQHQRKGGEPSGSKIGQYHH